MGYLFSFMQLNLPFFASENSTEVLFSLVRAVFAAAICTVMATPFMYFLQLIGYRPERGYVKIVRLPEFFVTLFSGIIHLISWLFIGKTAAVSSFVLLSFACIVFNCKRKRKTKFIGTARIKRQEIVNFLLFTFIGIFLPPAIILAIPVVVLISWLITLPLQTLINARFLSKAKRKLKRINPFVITVTGSFGKTTVKKWISILMNEKYNILATPESYNTPLGIAKTVNELMNDDTEFFICEAGARKKGDIAEICRLVEPDMGVIVGIAPQHLATFGCLDNVIAGKFELADFLREKFLSKNGKIALKNGVDCLNNKENNIITLDNFIYHEQCEIIKNELSRRNMRAFSCNSLRCNGDECSDNGVKSSFSESEQRFFTEDFMQTHMNDVEIADEQIPVLYREKNGLVRVAYGKESYYAKMSVDEDFQLYNAAIAVAVAVRCGVSLKNIAERLSLLTPPEHRMQIIEKGGITVIDDSYNANRASCLADIEALRRRNGKKIVVTAGIVEGGKEQFAFNRELGNKLSEVSDFVYITGINAKAIRLGLDEKGFDSGRIFLVRTPQEASEKMQAYLCRGDTVLFLNDLTDNFV